ncbi:MAG: hypothetical protein GF311_03430 [Candidatus Lokiarchaeota archaeon]|nr:hypothetical protein [Candidatus Lokiarchaeota archaeon]
MEPIIHPNELTDHPEWNESYYLAFYDREKELGIVSRLGYKPNKEEEMTFFFLFLPDDSGGGYFQEKKMKEFNDVLNVGGMTHGWNSDGTWNYKFEGNVIFVDNSEDLPKVSQNPKLISAAKQVELDIRFDPINTVYEYSKHMTEESLELGKKAGDKHWEQIAQINGTLKIGDKIYDFNDIIGQRDHTFGVRDWTGVGNWLYYVVWFDENLAVNPAAIIGKDGKLSTGGFLFKDGKNIPLKSIEVLNQTFRDDGLMPVSSRLKLTDNHDTTYILKAQVGQIIPVPFEDKSGQKSILVQSFGKFELDQRKDGYGTFETLRRE